MKTALKYIWLFLFLVFATSSFLFATDDSGESIGDFVGIAAYIITGCFYILTTFSWNRFYKTNRTRFIFSIMILPSFFCIAIFISALYTYNKINKDYYLHFINPNDCNRHFEYYFRNDSTVKTVGQYFWTTGYDFSDFKIKNDTLLIIETNVQGFDSQKYLIKKGSIKTENRDTLIPIDVDGKRMKFSSVLIQIKPTEYNY